MKKIELLAPAGDLERLKTAVDYGADAVYFGGESFSLRAGAGNLTVDEMREGIEYAHNRNCECYLTLNIYPHNDDLPEIKDYLQRIKDLPIDAFIMSDPGAMRLVKAAIPEAKIHLSTQANTTNIETALFWYELGVRRLVLARELSLKEIKELREALPDDMELEAFVHGAMCISYSGRCLLSNFMIGRDANRGACAHPCRWQYALVEQSRPGEYYPIEEDARGTYIMNSKDLCMIEHIPDMIDAGITSFKIEGRMKTMYYVATVISAYRMALDAYLTDPKTYEFKKEYMDELVKASHRHFTTGFYYGKPNEEDQNYVDGGYEADYTFTGVVISYDASNGLAFVEQRNKMSKGEEIEIFGPDMPFFKQLIEYMADEDGEEIESAPHAQQKIYIKVAQAVKAGDILRKRKEL